jgi:hypothetical protein
MVQQKTYILRYAGEDYKLKVDVHKSKYVIIIGEGIHCVDINVYRKIPMEHISLDSKSVAQLQGLSYDASCNMNGSHVKGQGTIDILVVALLFIGVKFPYVTTLRFQDTSKIKCKNNIYVDLSYLSIAKYGRTWYQDKFGATCLDKKVQSKINKINKHFTAAIEIAFDSFWEKYISLYAKDMQHVILSSMYEGMKRIYEDSSTLREFFIDVSKVDCKVFQIWFRKYFANTLSLNFTEVEWIMNVDDIIKKYKTSDLHIAKQHTSDLHTTKIKDNTVKTGGGHAKEIPAMYIGEYDSSIF